MRRRDFFRAIGAPVPAMLKELRGVEARVSKWMAFPRRNLAPSLGKDLVERARVYLHAQVVELVLAGMGRGWRRWWCGRRRGRGFGLRRTRWCWRRGRWRRARLLLASGVGNAHDQVGRNFHDHVTVAAATLTGAARARVVSELRPWVFFAGGWAMCAEGRCIV